ncbi:hypothetical protein niasHT_006006 [Heterodera trifolii]|uniref:Uncharacterized protein n=1 Tax=Heterodera trifolii TaxID=157864 RepID=A0ABD2LWY4_9BILA
MSGCGMYVANIDDSISNTISSYDDDCTAERRPPIESRAEIVDAFEVGAGTRHGPFVLDAKSPSNMRLPAAARTKMVNNSGSPVPQAHPLAIPSPLPSALHLCQFRLRVRFFLRVLPRL